jgi:hypothetical protein
MLWRWGAFAGFPDRDNPGRMLDYYPHFQQLRDTVARGSLNGIVTAALAEVRSSLDKAVDYELPRRPSWCKHPEAIDLTDRARSVPVRQRGAARPELQALEAEGQSLVGQASLVRSAAGRRTAARSGSQHSAPTPVYTMSYRSPHTRAALSTSLTTKRAGTPARSAIPRAAPIAAGEKSIPVAAAPRRAHDSVSSPDRTPARRERRDLAGASPGAAPEPIAANAVA